MRDEDRARVVTIAKSWLGTPYVNHARVKGAGVDCGQLLLAVYGEAGLIPNFDVGYYPEQWHMHRDEEKYLGNVLRYGQEVTIPLPGDAVMFKFGRVFSHGGIVVEWPNIIHAIRLAGCIMDDVEKCIIGPKALGNLPRMYFTYVGERVAA